MWARVAQLALRGTEIPKREGFEWVAGGNPSLQSTLKIFLAVIVSVAGIATASVLHGQFFNGRQRYGRLPGGSENSRRRIGGDDIQGGGEGDVDDDSDDNSVGMGKPVETVSL